MLSVGPFVHWKSTAFLLGLSSKANLNLLVILLLLTAAASVVYAMAGCIAI